MHEQDGRGLGRRQVVGQPIELLRRDIGVAVVEVAVVVGGAVGAEVGVEDDKMNAAAIEGVIAAFGVDPGVLDAGEELRLGDTVHVVVAEDVVPRSGKGGELGFDLAQVAERLRLDAGLVLVLEVAELDEKVDPLGVHQLDALAHLGSRLAIEARAAFLAVGRSAGR